MMIIKIKRNSAVVEQFTLPGSTDHKSLWAEVRRRIFHKLSKAEKNRMVMTEPRGEKYPWNYFKKQGFTINVRPSKTR